MKKPSPQKDPGRKARGPKKARAGAAAESPQKARLLSELAGALTQIDEEGLLFLLRQAQVLIHNAAVDRLNREQQELERKKPPRTAAETPAARAGVSIEDPGDGRAVFLVLGRVRKVLSPEEVKRLVQICYGAESKSEALAQLYRVLVRERKDILADANIGTASNPLLERIFTAVRTRYRLEERIP